MSSLDDLTQPRSPEQILANFYAYLERVGIPVTVWKPLSPMRFLLKVVAVVFSAYTYWSCGAVRAMFLHLSSGDWLRAKAKYDYGTDWHSATAASGVVKLVNVSVNTYDLDPGDLAIIYTALSADGLTNVIQTYALNAAVTVGPSTSVNGSFTCTIAGSAGTLPAGAAVTLSPGFSGLNATVETPLIGTDDEDDQALITRAQSAASATSPAGPKDAWRYVATSYMRSGVQVCTRVQVRPGNPLTVFLGNASGGLSGADLAEVTLDLRTKVEALGVVANIVSGNAKNIYVAYSVWCRKTTLSAATIKATIDAAVTQYVGAFPMGGDAVALVDGAHPAGTRWMYLDDLESVIMTAVPRAYPNVSNPVYHALVSAGDFYNDIQFATGDIATLAGAPVGGVYFE
jgi:phage-related baseplate assembly protein